MRRLRAPAVAATLFAAGLSAQVTVSLTTATAAGARAAVAGKVVVQGTPANTLIPLDRPLVHTASSSASATQSGSASLLAGAFSSYPGVNLVGDANARGDASDGAGSAPAASAQNSAFGAAAFLMRFSTPQATSGYLAFTWQTVEQQTATVGATVDIGDNSSIEWTGTGTQSAMRSYSLPVQIPAQGLVVRLAVQNLANGAGQTLGSSRAYVALRLRFVAASAFQCKVTPYGQGCGPQLAGSVVTLGGQHVITLALTGGYPGSFALHAIGTQQINLNLGGGCALLSNAVFIGLEPTDANGDAVQILRLPVTTTGSSYHQYLPLAVQGGNLVLRASNGLKIEASGG